MIPRNIPDAFPLLHLAKIGAPPLSTHLYLYQLADVGFDFTVKDYLSYYIQWTAYNI